MPFAAHRLHARRAINVCHSRQRRERVLQPRKTGRLVRRTGQALALRHVRNQQHVRRLGSEVEIFARPLLQHRWGERPERFAELDLLVDRRLHRSQAGVAQDRAAAKRARPELHPPLKPAKHRAIGQQPGGALEHRCLVELLEHRAVRLERPPNFRLRELRAKQAAAHRVAARAWPIGLALPFRLGIFELVPRLEGSTESAAGVTGGRLDPNLVEHTCALKFAVCHTVERDATGEAKPVFAGHLAGLFGQAQHHLADDLLHRGGDVHVPLLERRLGIARRPAQQLLEPAVGHFAALEKTEVIHVQPERAVRLQIDHVFNNRSGKTRLAVRREAHQLVLAGVDAKPAVHRER